MGSSSTEKWFSRAERYEEILAEDGVRAAEDYLLQFSSNFRKLLDALWELHILKIREKKARRREYQLYLSKRSAKDRMEQK